MPVSNRFAARWAILLAVVGAVVALGAMVVRAPSRPDPWTRDNWPQTSGHAVARRREHFAQLDLKQRGRIAMDGDNAFQLFMKGASGHRLYRSPMP